MNEGTAIYEDEVLLAWDKPAGIIVHGDGTGARTLTDVVSAHLAATGRVGVRPQPVQRLDAETTGLVLFSLDRATQPALDAQVAGHAMNKTYLAVVAGRVPWAEKVVRQPIGRDRHDARKMRVSPSGKPAATRVRPLAEKQVDGRTCTLLSVVIETGRKHQIRVHLSHAGFPLVGDVLYNPTVRRNEPLMLQAHRLTFTHPVTGEHVAITAPTPAWTIA